jgi:hypothetical protein
MKKTLLAVLAASLLVSGCIVVPGGPGFYDHPYYHRPYYRY